MYSLDLKLICKLPAPLLGKSESSTVAPIRPEDGESITAGFLQKLDNNPEILITAGFTQNPGVLALVN